MNDNKRIGEDTKEVLVGFLEWGIFIWERGKIIVGRINPRIFPKKLNLLIGGRGYDNTGRFIK